MKGAIIPAPCGISKDLSPGSDSDYTKYWIDWFLGTKGNEYFCEVDEEYILDRFNLTGLNTEVQYYSQALDLITDNLDENLDEEMRDIVEKSARHLYGLIHARFIITTHGLTKMLEKFKKCDFGRCPRVLCHNHPLLPVALSDVPYSKSVKLFCCRCEDIYNPKSSRHASIDGAYFGCSFPHMLFQVYPQLVPPKSTDRYVPRIFGFKLHDVAKQHRYQDMIREETGDAGNDAPFVDDDEELEAEEEAPGKDAKKDRLFKLDANESEPEN
ncbi:MAG: casein kinase II beta subunit [Linnemannia elongata]|nr:MAG: casein kinase II beta subunit [Linnemannia elongata]